MGSGYRVFTAGEVLTASNVQNFLQDQAVMVFGGTAARSSAIGTANFEEGMLTYLTDVDKLQVYTGAAFADVYPAAATNQGLTLINTTSFSGVASQQVNAVFSSTYLNYKILVNLTSVSSASTGLRLQLGTSGTIDTGNNYAYAGAQFDAASDGINYRRSTPTGSWEVNGVGSSGATQQNIDLLSPFQTAVTSYGSTSMGYSTATRLTRIIYGMTSVTTSYTDLKLAIGAGTMTGSLNVYGFNVQENR